MRHRLLIPAALALLLVLGAPTGAIGGVAVDPNLGDVVYGTVGGLRYASDPDTYAPSGFSSPETGCGGSLWRVLGGGSASGGPPGTAWLAFDRPLDYDDVDLTLDDGWLSGGFGPPAEADLTGYTICIREENIRYRSTVVDSGASGLRTGSVMCGGTGWQVVTGSVAIATSQSWVNSSFPIDGDDANATPDDGWRGRVNDTAGGPGGFYVHAICVRGYSVRYVKGASAPLPAGGSVGVKVACAPGEHVVGGGAKISGPPDHSRLVSTYPYDGGDANQIPDDGWRVRAYNVSAGALTVQPWAICLG